MKYTEAGEIRKENLLENLLKTARWMREDMDEEELADVLFWVTEQIVEQAVASTIRIMQTRDLDAAMGIDLDYDDLNRRLDERRTAERLLKE